MLGSVSSAVDGALFTVATSVIADNIYYKFIKGSLFRMLTCSSDICVFLYFDIPRTAKLCVPCQKLSIVYMGHNSPKFIKVLCLECLL